MSKYYGTLQGNRGEATRCGSKDSGITTDAAGWGGAVRVCVFDNDGVDWARVCLTKWHGAGVEKPLYDGPVNPDMVVAEPGEGQHTRLVGRLFKSGGN